MKRWGMLILVFLLLAGGVGLAIWQPWQKEKITKDASKKELNLPVQIQEERFSISLPEGWFKDKSPAHNPAQFIYRDNRNENMFSVIVNESNKPLRSGESVSTHDYIWTILEDGKNRLKIDKKSPHCDQLITTSYQGNSGGHKVVEFDEVIFFCNKHPGEVGVGIYHSGPYLEATLLGNRYRFFVHSFSNSLDYNLFLSNVLGSFRAKEK